MRSRSTLLRFIVPLLVLGGLACGPCNLISGEVPTPPRPVAVSTEAAGRLESRLQQTLQGQPGQEFIVRMTDDEVTSLVDTQLAKYSESPVTSPQIWFTNGKVYGTGRLVNVLPIETDFYFVANAHVQDGKVVVDMEKVSAGALPVPTSVLDTLSQSINQTVEEAQLGVQVTDLEILEGEIIVRGVKE
jgi:uncharacterized protein YpmS